MGLLRLKTQISPSKIKEFFSKSAIFIIPSIVDNLPYAVLELMGQGKILIVSQQGGQSEIISNDEDGFIFDYTTPGSFEITLNKVTHLTKEERLSVSARAVKKISANYSYDKIYSEKIKLLNELLLSENNVLPDKFSYVRSLPAKTNDHFKDDTFNAGKLSIIIPYYNMGKYINETVLSVLRSSYKNIEVLIINDGSTGLSDIKKLMRFRKNHPVVKVIDKPNTGLADTRNYGAKMATGEFLAFLDADDKVGKTYYKKAIQILSHYKNVHFVGAWTQFFGNSKAIWPTFNPTPPLIFTHNTINSSALVYKKHSFLNAGLNDPSFKIGLEDYESVVSMLANGLNGVAIPEILFYYRVRKGSMIKKSTPEVRRDYYHKIINKHKIFHALFEKEVSELNKNNGLPLSYDNSTLDDLPFQQIPVIRTSYRKLHHLIKSNPKLKKVALGIKQIKFR